MKKLIFSILILFATSALAADPFIKTAAGNSVQIKTAAGAGVSVKTVQYFPVIAVLGQSNASLMLWPIVAESVWSSGDSAYTSPANSYEYNGINQTLNRIAEGKVSQGTVENPANFQSFCQTFGALIDKPFGVVDTSVPGSGLQDGVGMYCWYPEDVDGLYDTAISDINAALAAFAAAGHPNPYLAGIIYPQGEADAEAGGNIAGYKAAFSLLASGLRSTYASNLPIFMVRTGRLTSSDPTGYQNIRQAQDEICAADPLTHMAYTDSVNFPSYGWMVPESPDVHYATLGIDDIGVTIAPIVYQYMLPP